MTFDVMLNVIDDRISVKLNPDVSDVIGLELLEKWKAEYGYSYSGFKRYCNDCKELSETLKAKIAELLTLPEYACCRKSGGYGETKAEFETRVFNSCFRQLLPLYESFESWSDAMGAEAVHSVARLCKQYIGDSAMSKFWVLLKKTVKDCFGTLEYQDIFDDFIFKFSDDEEDQSKYASEFFEWVLQANADDLVNFYEKIYCLQDDIKTDRHLRALREQKKARKPYAELTSAQRLSRRTAEYNKWEREEVYDKDGTCTGYEERI